MKYKRLGNTGLKVSELCLGTMTFGGRGYWTQIGSLEQKIVNDIVKTSIDAGINFIDTANVYSEGLAEEMTGRAIKDLGFKRDGLVIATKVRGKISDDPNGSGLSRKHIMNQVEESLKRLRTDYIDLYQIHGYDSQTPLEETIEALDVLVKSGKVRYISCSNLSAWHVMKAVDYSRYKNLASFVSLQAYYTLAGRDLEREIIPMLKDQNLGLMVWSPLAGGFLTGKFRKDSKDENARRGHFDFPPINKERAYEIVDALDEMAKEKNASIAQLALAWLLHQEAVTSIIVGAKNTDQLKDNLLSVDISFTEEELKRLDQISRLPEEYPGWMIQRQNS